MEKLAAEMSLSRPTRAMGAASTARYRVQFRVSMRMPTNSPTPTKNISRASGQTRPFQSTGQERSSPIYFFFLTLILRTWSTWPSGMKKVFLSAGNSPLRTSSTYWAMASAEAWPSSA